ncbi:unnamed protein product, partial [Mesorhabditis belari]|uniref:C-type lectin domain-containing protein n=1 Tax=Mesorhabditis belari TaxID=2138241 RepID=A0AAF3EH75_9BILA
MYATVNGTGLATDWRSAYFYCDQQQGTLLSIHNTFQNNLLADLQKNVTGYDAELWLGAFLNANGSWAWTDDTPFDYQRFQSSANGDFATLDSRDGLWKKRTMMQNKTFFCMSLVTTSTPSTLTTSTPSILTTQPPQVCLPVDQQPLYNCRDGWQYSPETGFQYLVFYDTRVSAAEAICQSQGGHLASIHSKAENDFIAGLCCENGCDYLSHVGSNFGWYIVGGKLINGTVQWIDGSPSDYQQNSCLANGDGNWLIIMNYDSNCNRFTCGGGTWDFDGYDWDIAPYTICKKK